MSIFGIEVLGPGAPEDPHDLFLGTLGYESRSSYLARKKQISAARRIAFAFPEEDYAAYLSNQSFLARCGFDIVPKASENIRETLREALRDHITASCDSFSVLIDISSMSRPMLADLVFTLSNLNVDCRIEATFVYLPATFVRSDAEHAPVAVSEPVTPDYAGWTVSPELPITAVVGLGYEQDLALGALEFLEPNSAWGFVPTGEDRRYDNAVKEANRTLDPVLSDDRTMVYKVDRPARVYTALETLVYGLLQWSRPILIPFGPKIFSLCCLLIARTYADDVTVWRVSGESLARPGDREASGKIISLKAVFARQPAFRHQLSAAASQA